MKRRILLVVIFMIITGYIFAKENLAILPFTGGQGDEGETIAELFSFDDRLNDVFSPIPRTSITQAIRREQRFQENSGMTDPDTIVAIGHQLGARYVVAGNITSVGNNNLLVISIIDIRNLQQIAGDYQTYTNMMDIRRKLPNMAGNIIQATQRNTASLPKLAIIPVQLQGGADRNLADTLTQILSIHLIRSGRYTVYPRTQSLEQVMDEHRIQFSGITADSNIVGIGYGENPDFVLSVAARMLEDANMFNASIINLFSGAQVVGRSVDYMDINDGIRAMERLSLDLHSTSEQIMQRNQAEEERQRRIARAEEQRWRRIARKEARKKAAFRNSLGGPGVLAYWNNENSILGFTNETTFHWSPLPFFSMGIGVGSGFFGDNKYPIIWNVTPQLGIYVPFLTNKIKTSIFADAIFHISGLGLGDDLLSNGLAPGLNLGISFTNKSGYGLNVMYRGLFFDDNILMHGVGVSFVFWPGNYSNSGPGWVTWGAGNGTWHYVLGLLTLMSSSVE